MNDDQIAAKLLELACNEVFAFVKMVPNPSKRDIHERIFRVVPQKFSEHGQLLWSLVIKARSANGATAYEVTANELPKATILLQ